MMTLLAIMLSYHQLERLWLHAGGSPYLAPTMAAVAVAESHPLGDAHHARMALVNYDRHELGGSFCGWQIQVLHTYPLARGEKPWSRYGLLHDPLYCAKAAVYVQRRFGLDAWTTHRTGNFLEFIEREQPRQAAPELTPIPERHPNLTAMLRPAQDRNALHIVHPRRYTAFIPPSRPEQKPSPSETIALGLVAVGLAAYACRAIRCAREADEALKRRMRRRSTAYRARHRGIAA